MPVTWSDEKLIPLYCPGRGSNSRPSARRSFKHDQGVPRPNHSATARRRQKHRGTERERQRAILFFLWFPLCRGEADLATVTAKYGYFRNLPLAPVVGPFSPFFFVLCLSHIDLSPHRPPISAGVFLVFWNLLASLSRLFSVVYHISFRFGPCVQPISSSLNYFANYTSFSSNFS